MAATILEIAKRLNISHTTVSRVLNNKSNVFVSDEMRERVLRAAQEMGYLPNLAARSLRDSSTNAIAVFGSPVAGVWGGITPEIVRGLSRALHAKCYGVFFAFNDTEEHDERAISSWRFDGAIVLQSPTAPTLQCLAKAGRPFVCVNEQIDGNPAVVCDEDGGVRLALDHLWAQGHRRIAYANRDSWHLPHYSVDERHDAYLAYLVERGIAPIAWHDVVSEHQDRTEFLRSAVITHGATAVLAYDHVVAVRVMSAAYKLGLKIPQDFSLICFNDEFPVADVFPALTVVSPMGEIMGQRGGEMLLSMLASPQLPAPSLVRIEERLVVRDSTAPPAESR